MKYFTLSRAHYKTCISISLLIVLFAVLLIPFYGYTGYRGVGFALALYLLSIVIFKLRDKSLNSLVVVALSMCISSHSLYFLGMIGSYSHFAALLGFLLIWNVTESNKLLLLSFSFLIIALTANATLEVSGLINSIYYRPNETLHRHDTRGDFFSYKKNQTINMTILHGDLANIDKNIDKVPRSSIFITDKDGFRNKDNYSEQGLLLVGDSFIVGNGNTQDDILNSILEDKYGIDTYNLSIPAGPSSYASNLELFKDKYGSNFRAILFFYEGNDFDGLRINEAKVSNAEVIKNVSENWKNRLKRLMNDNLSSRMISSYADFVVRYRNASRDTALYRYSYSVYERILFDLRQNTDTSGLVDHLTINGRTLNYLISNSEPYYIDDFNGHDLTAMYENVRDHILHVYYIPTKYRVYNQINVQKKEELKDSIYFNYLSSEMDKSGIEVTDLTYPLIRRSQSLLEEDKLTWWEDDTHWNKYGIEVAADEIYALLSDQIAAIAH